MPHNMDNLPSYLVFAFTNAREALAKLVWGFDFEKRAGDHNYTEIRPQYLLEVINGFLEHESHNLFISDINRLSDMKDRLETRLIPLYERGKDSASNVLLQAPLNKKAEFEEVDNPELREMARGLAPDGLKPSELSWFLEGFCRQWAEELLQYIVWAYGQDIEDEE